jgi:hypothetical protein
LLHKSPNKKREEIVCQGITDASPYRFCKKALTKRVRIVTSSVAARRAVKEEDQVRRGIFQKAMRLKKKIRDVSKAIQMIAEKRRALPVRK